MSISLFSKCLLNKLMKRLEIILIAILAVSACELSFAQTARSLFRVCDSLQVSEIVSETGDQYEETGHHGPAVENSHMILRLFFNDSGAIDVYSKSGRGMELERFKWYPSDSMKESGMSGGDAYTVANTLGLGGIALWDGEKQVNLVATKGRTARTGDTKKGTYAELIAYGVEYEGELVDVSIRIDVESKSREAVVTARSLTGKKICFVTGVNYHEGQKVVTEDGYISVWGVHSGQEDGFPIGAGLFYQPKVFPTVEKTSDMVRIISSPSAEVKTRIMAASVREAEINNAKRFEAYMAK